MDVGYGENVGPSAYLPDGSVTGRTNGTDTLFGAADIESLYCIADFNPVEIAKYDFPFSPKELFAEKVKDGYDTGLGYTIGITDADRNQWVQLLVMMREGNAPDDTTVSISDITGQLHQVTLAEFRTLMVAAGLYYQTLWTNYKTAIAAS